MTLDWDEDDGVNTLYFDRGNIRLEPDDVTIVADAADIHLAIQQAAQEGVEFIVFNPGAFTHTSIALRDVFLAVAIPFIEIHLSNTFAREEFRQNSYFSDIAQSCLFGFGAYGYELALHAANRHVTNAEEK